MVLIFILVCVGLLFLLIIWSVVFGSDTSASQTLALRSAREIAEAEAQAELDDREQMVALHNRDRVARGQREISADELESQIISEDDEIRRQAQDRNGGRGAPLEGVELDEYVEMTNADRRSRGLPPLSREEVSRGLQGM